MEFITMATPAVLNEPRIDVSVNEDQINEIKVYPYLFNCFDFDESDNDDLVLFGVGGPA